MGTNTLNLKSNNLLVYLKSDITGILLFLIFYESKARLWRVMISKQKCGAITVDSHWTWKEARSLLARTEHKVDLQEWDEQTQIFFTHFQHLF